MIWGSQSGDCKDFYILGRFEGKLSPSSRPKYKPIKKPGWKYKASIVLRLTFNGLNGVIFLKIELFVMNLTDISFWPSSPPLSVSECKKWNWHLKDKTNFSSVNYVPCFCTNFESHGKSELFIVWYSFDSIFLRVSPLNWLLFFHLFSGITPILILTTFSSIKHDF
jgi:hypothetical protein